MNEKCGCKVVGDCTQEYEFDGEIEYCPTHAAAFDMRRKVATLLVLLDKMGMGDCPCAKPDCRDLFSAKQDVKDDLASARGEGDKDG
jgi:hypothetical protein